MATKDGKRVEMMALRSSRRVKPIEVREEKILEEENCAEGADSNDHPNQIEEHKEQQICPKNEKESTSPPNNEMPIQTILQERSRRLTRSTAHLCKKICSQMDLQNDPLTPEDNQISRVQEQPTCKKLLKAPSVYSLPEVNSPDLMATAKKAMLGRLQCVVSPYSEIRKSYRKMHKRDIISIPYRKCHDAFEGRIVTIINKIESGKNCLRDFESLIEKMQRITGKDMMNRFIIGGIKTILKLGREKDIYDVNRPQFQLKLLERLEREEERLRERIDEELDRMDDFQHCLLHKNQELIDSREYRRMTIRKIYRVMKMKMKSVRGGVGEIRSRVLSDCEKHFSGEANVGTLIRFIKQKMEMGE